jgi:hypothetical protein
VEVSPSVAERRLESVAGAALGDAVIDSGSRTREKLAVMHALLIAEQTFLGWRADAWSAVGLWITLVASALLARYAYRQLKEAQELRHEQTRPFVIVDVRFRSFLIEIEMHNAGTTAARDVRVEFAEPLTSAESDPDWQHSTAFTTGVPMMAPGRQMRFFLDSYHKRVEQGLPQVIRGRVSYLGPVESQHRTYDEDFVIDLTVYEGSQLPEDGFPELVNEVREMRKELLKWTDGVRGLQVHTINKLRNGRVTDRPLHLRMARQAAATGGRRAFVVYYVQLWRRRYGLYAR